MKNKERVPVPLIKRERRDQDPEVVQQLLRQFSALKEVKMTICPGESEAHASTNRTGLCWAKKVCWKYHVREAALSSTLTIPHLSMKCPPSWQASSSAAKTETLVTAKAREEASDRNAFPEIVGTNSNSLLFRNTISQISHDKSKGFLHRARAMPVHDRANQPNSPSSLLTIEVIFRVTVQFLQSGLISINFW